MSNKEIKSSENFSFSEVVKRASKDINKRTMDIIADRFGFFGREPQTLDSIGKKHGITRERVRQIIQDSVKKIRKNSQNSKYLSEAENIFEFTLKDNYGIIRRDKLVKFLAKSQEEHPFIEFVLHCSLVTKSINNKNEVNDAIVSISFDIQEWKEVKNLTKEILDEKGNTFTEEELYSHFVKKNPGFDRKKLIAFLSVSHEIKRNNFKKWGIHHWEEIKPRGTRQKAHLVLKEVGEPLHFSKVAECIDKFKLSDNKKTHPQTVHNELIKDERFVLIGRGTYALRDWGHKEGTVKEVIEGILKNSDKPVHQSKIVEKVLSERNVKEATVLINLSNHFQKNESKEYFL